MQPRDYPDLDVLSIADPFLVLEFSALLEEDLPLCSSQTCCFPSCTSSLYGLAAAVVLLHHFQGIAWWHFFYFAVPEYLCDQISRKILGLGCWCLPPATCLYCSELSLSMLCLCQGFQMRIYENYARIQGRNTKLSGFHIKCCCRKHCWTTQPLDFSESFSLSPLTFCNPQTLSIMQSSRKMEMVRKKKVMF